MLSNCFFKILWQIEMGDQNIFDSPVWASLFENIPHVTILSYYHELILLFYLQGTPFNYPNVISIRKYQVTYKPENWWQRDLFLLCHDFN